MNVNYRNILFDAKKNSIAIMTFIGIFLVLSPLFGIKWIQLGDFTLPVINYYHIIMIPFALLLIIVAASIIGISKRIQKIINISVYPILFLTFIGLVLFYPSNTVFADELAQSLRDIWVMFNAFIFIYGLIIFPFFNKNRFKEIWGAYSLVFLGVVSATLAGVFGMLLEYGTLFGYSNFPFFASYIQSIGGTNTFLGNLLTSHSHQMLPAVMGAIVGLTAIAFRYNEHGKGTRAIINFGMLISIFGVISMSYLYWISSFGTYIIPTLFASGPGGVNGLALDDTQTGLIGIGALISIIGLYFTLSKEKGTKTIQYIVIGSWLAAAITLFVVGYMIELNETYFGFGSAGTAPNGGPGYLYDQAFLNGHLLYVFFMLVIVAGIFLAFNYLIPERKAEKSKKTIGIIEIFGIVVAGLGLVVYVETLSWLIFAVGLCIMVFPLLAIPYELIKESRREVKIKALA